MYTKYAEEDDLGYIEAVCGKFTAYYPEGIPVNTEDTLALVERLMDGDGIVIVAVDQGSPVGVIGGAVSPFVYSPDKLIAAELFLWVEDSHREAGVATALLKAYEAEAVECGVDVISMCTTVKTPYLDGFYKCNGYKPVEKSYMRVL